MNKHTVGRGGEIHTILNNKPIAAEGQLGVVTNELEGCKFDFPVSG